MAKENTLINALIGAAVTVVLSFTGVSPLLGGAAAGYLQANGPGDGARVGAISGIVASLPLILVLALFAGALPFAPIEFAALGVVAILFVVVFAVGFTAALSAAGGYIGGYLEAEY
ncbi:DUF5518 domain-containing protein [Salarchaeum sp. JOR-1]|uniref:DUF5518 domain-containing protein n=1 Tax=Salarchaeum sp. JOR-1 TaxID=2599399 RepID=UPI0011989612|nr:DUF5518 domain-containing protein [Salarchaeum sp. JOR-1]QDX40633.1 hypothetical protein FQU85_06850 [Salarchaeum sp. JOR-1]